MAQTRAQEKKPELPVTSVTRHGDRAPRLTTRARLERCPRCGCAVLRALTQPPAAWEAKADPVPLDAAAEIRALLAGRITYDLAGISARKELIPRDQHRVKRRDWPVLADHQCPGPVPWAAIPPPPPPENGTGEIPF